MNTATDHPTQTAIYTDGSLGYAGAGGWAFIVHKDGTTIERAGFVHGTTSQRMELTAIIMAMTYCLENDVPQPVIFSDSEYSVKTFTLWARRWKPQDWPKKRNTDLVRQGLRLYGQLKPRLQWVRGHNGTEGNERADKLARMAAIDQHPFGSRYEPKPADFVLQAAAPMALAELTAEEMEWVRRHLMRLDMRLRQDCRTEHAKALALLGEKHRFWTQVRDEMLALSRSKSGPIGAGYLRKAKIAASYL